MSSIEDVMAVVDELTLIRKQLKDEAQARITQSEKEAKQRAEQQTDFLDRTDALLKKLQQTTDLQKKINGREKKHILGYIGFGAAVGLIIGVVACFFVNDWLNKDLLASRAEASRQADKIHAIAEDLGALQAYRPLAAFLLKRKVNFNVDVVDGDHCNIMIPEKFINLKKFPSYKSASGEEGACITFDK